uniref:USP8 dimerisation domain-containing protein n=1 Tax=Panagrolaimus sp. PS1159 TaxID=55785 RepID=A0AC35FVX3_9BILA
MMGFLEGPLVTPTLIRDPIRRLCTLVDLARPHGISTTVPLFRFCHMLNDMYELAGVYTKEGNIEKAFVLYLRFVGIVVEELPKHKDYATFSLTEKDNYDRQTIRAMNTAEVLKRRIKAKYEQDAAAAKKQDNEHDGHENSIGSIPISPPPIDINLKSYVVCQKQIGYSLLFQRVVIPNDLPQKFLDICKNTIESERFAVIYGKLVRNSLIITHLVITDGSEKILDQLDRSITEIDDDTNEPIELFIVGCVCGTLSQSSVEKFISRSLLTEIVCIVCRRGKNQTYVIHLSNLPERKHEDKGLGAETAATVMEVEKHDSSLHDSTSNQSGFQDTCQSICSHVHITPSLSVAITDSRKGDENTVKFMSHRT